MPQGNTRNQTIILAVCIVLLIGAGIWFLVPRHHSSGPTATTSSVNEPTYVGTDQLLNVGATAGVIDDLKFSIHRFLTQNPPLNQTVTVSNVEHHHDRNTGNETYVFKLTIGSNDYAAVLQSPGLTSGQLTLSKGGQQIFDSGLVDISNQP